MPHILTCYHGMNLTHMLTLVSLAPTGSYYIWVFYVQPFSNDFSVTKNMPIGHRIFKFVHPQTGLTIILGMPQVLYFGNKLCQSLWNPNKIFHFGISLCKGPFDPQHDLDMMVPSLDDFETQASFVCFQSMVPTNHELDQLPWIQIMD